MERCDARDEVPPGAATVPVVDGELIEDESGCGFALPEFVRIADGWVSLRALGVPLPIDVTPRAPRRPRIRMCAIAGHVTTGRRGQLASVHVVRSFRVETHR